MSKPSPAAAIAANLARVRAAIAATATRAGRRAEEIKLIAVSKTQPVEAVAAAVAAGQRVFGENTAQEAMTKIPMLSAQNLEWHFIGHLQSNKTRHIPGNFTWLHSLDSLKLAQRVARAAEERDATVQALIEVNITRDPARHGVDPAQTPALVEQLLAAKLPGLALRGFMAIGPHPATEAEQRTAFAALHALLGQCARFAPPDFSELSMGMSGDFHAAVLEGSTLVRIGSAIFGDRVR